MPKTGSDARVGELCGDYPTTPLSDEAESKMQADIDTLGEMFVALVARNRGPELPPSMKASNA